jgi:uncharacterized membrane protein (DUF485 family)
LTVSRSKRTLRNKNKNKKAVLSLDFVGGAYPTFIRWISFYSSFYPSARKGASMTWGFPLQKGRGVNNVLRSLENSGEKRHHPVWGV